MPNTKCFDPLEDPSNYNYKVFSLDNLESGKSSNYLH